MKRVLYFTGYRMAAQEWHGHRLETSIYFEPDEQGLDMFKLYLRSFSNEPVRLLIDLIEEEFRKIKIPLLRGSDRKAILERQYLKYFRHSKYRYAVSQGTEAKQRKEENLLLMGLTNQALLKPWLNAIAETHTPLSGIVSLPLLAEQCLSLFDTSGRAVILVSQQVPSNLRQSVFIDGKLALSRLVPIASFYQGDYATDVLRDIKGTRRYLGSQHMIERGDSLSVQIMTNARHIDNLRSRFSEENLFDFKVHDINQILEKEKINIRGEQDFSSGLFCYFASRKMPVNHYARTREKKYYRHYISAMVLKLASVAIVAIGTGVGAASAIAGWMYGDSAGQTVQLEQNYAAKLKRLDNSRVDSTTSTSSMQNIVQTLEMIEKNYLDDPQQLLSMVSQDVSLFSDIRIRRFDWFVSDQPHTESVGDVSWEKKRARRGRDDQNKKKVTAKKSSANSYFEVATVEGEFLGFDGNYRYALSALDDLEKAMIESGKYFYVEITRRPLDIESGSQLSGNVSLGRAVQTPKAELAFRVVREVIPDEQN